MVGVNAPGTTLALAGCMTCNSWSKLTALFRLALQKEVEEKNVCCLKIQDI